MIQELVNLPVDVDYASEFEYRNSLLGPDEDHGCHYPIWRDS
jgi:hypothetical protein